MIEINEYFFDNKLDAIYYVADTLHCSALIQLIKTFKKFSYDRPIKYKTIFMNRCEVFFDDILNSYIKNPHFNQLNLAFFNDYLNFNHFNKIQIHTRLQSSDNKLYKRELTDKFGFLQRLACEYEEEIRDMFAKDGVDFDYINRNIHSMKRGDGITTLNNIYNIHHILPLAFDVNSDKNQTLRNDKNILMIDKIKNEGNDFMNSIDNLLLVDKITHAAIHLYQEQKAYKKNHIPSQYGDYKKVELMFINLTIKAFREKEPTVVFPKEEVENKKPGYFEQDNHLVYTLADLQKTL